MSEITVSVELGYERRVYFFFLQSLPVDRSKPGVLFDVSNIFHSFFRLFLEQFLKEVFQLGTPVLT